MIISVHEAHRRVCELRHLAYMSLHASAKPYFEKWLEAMEWVRYHHPEFTKIIDRQIQRKRRDLESRPKPQISLEP